MIDHADASSANTSAPKTAVPRTALRLRDRETLHGVDIAESARNGQATVVVHAFQIGFMATAGVALLGAACAFRLPRIHL